MEITREALQYDIEALKANLDRCDANVAIFEEAIDKERREKRRLAQIIEVLEGDLERKRSPA